MGNTLEPVSIGSRPPRLNVNDNERLRLVTRIVNRAINRDGEDGKCNVVTRRAGVSRCRCHRDRRLVLLRYDRSRRAGSVRSRRVVPHLDVDKGLSWRHPAPAGRRGDARPRRRGEWARTDRVSGVHAGAAGDDDRRLPDRGGQRSFVRAAHRDAEVHVGGRYVRRAGGGGAGSSAGRWWSRRSIRRWRRRRRRGW